MNGRIMRTSWLYTKDGSTVSRNLRNLKFVWLSFVSLKKGAKHGVSWVHKNYNVSTNIELVVV